MSAPGGRETEIKLRIASVAAARALLRKHGFRIARRRVHEDNVLFDSPELGLFRQGLLLRLRRAGSRAILTFKGAAVPGKHKSRPETEAIIADPGALETILRGCGFLTVFRYEKYRTEYRGIDPVGVVTLDETPIGVFFELEGAPDWIDRTAALLGFAEKDYITMSYGSLYIAYASSRGLDPAEMLFRQKPANSPRSPQKS